MGGRGGEGEGWDRVSDFYTATFVAGEANKSSHIEPIPHHKAREASSQRWEQFQVIAGLNGAMHSLNCDITGSAKCPPESRPAHIYWTVEMLCIDSY